MSTKQYWQPEQRMTEITQRNLAQRSSSLRILRRLSLFITLLSVLCVGVGCLCTPPQDERSGLEPNIGKSPPVVADTPAIADTPVVADTPVIADTPASAGSSGAVQVPMKEFFLELDSPGVREAVVTDPSLTIEGRTRIDAFVTVNEHVVEPNIEGGFRQVVELVPGLNIIEVIASTAGGEQKSVVLGIGYRAE